VCSIRGGRTRSHTNPYDNRTETPLLLSWQSVGEEVGRVDRCPVDLPSLDKVTSLRTNSVLDTIEWVSKTPWSDLTGMWACLPTGLVKGVVRQSEQ